MEWELWQEIHTYLDQHQLLSVSELFKILDNDLLVVLYPALTHIVLEYLFDQIKLVAPFWKYCREQNSWQKCSFVWNRIQSKVIPSSVAIDVIRQVGYLCHDSFQKTLHRILHIEAFRSNFNSSFKTHVDIHWYQSDMYVLTTFHRHALEVVIAKHEWFDNSNEKLQIRDQQTFCGTMAKHLLPEHFLTKNLSILHRATDFSDESETVQVINSEFNVFDDNNVFYVDKIMGPDIRLNQKNWNFEIKLKQTMEQIAKPYSFLKSKREKKNSIDSKTQKHITKLIQSKNFSSIRMNAMSYFEMGKINAATQLYYAAWKEDPNDRYILAHYGFALLFSNRQSHEEKGAQFLYQAVENGESLAKHFLLSWCPQSLQTPSLKESIAIIVKMTRFCKKENKMPTSLH